MLDFAGIPLPDDGLARSRPIHDQRLEVTVAQMREQSGYIDEVQRLNESRDFGPVSGDWMTVSDGTWKLWVSSKNEFRLHHVLQDPAEAINVADGFPEIVARLEKHLSTLPAFDRGALAPESDEDAREMLRILGYGE